MWDRRRWLGLSGEDPADLLVGWSFRGAGEINEELGRRLKILARRRMWWFASPKERARSLAQVEALMVGLHLRRLEEVWRRNNLPLRLTFSPEVPLPIVEGLWREGHFYGG